MTKPFYTGSCLCYFDGARRHTPDACPVHGWRTNPTPERLEECRRERAEHDRTTRESLARSSASTELSDLRWVAMHILISHDRAALRLANAVPEACLDKICPCSLCRTARPWVGTPEIGVCSPAEDALFEEMDARQRAAGE